MHVDVHWDRCEGHALCVERAPEMFDLDDDGNLTFTHEDEPVPSRLHEQASAAATACPVAALRIRD